VASIAWAEADGEPDEDPEVEETDGDAEVENLAARRLRRWLNGMFGSSGDKQEG
jgi:hypothetical protein